MVDVGVLLNLITEQVGADINWLLLAMAIIIIKKPLYQLLYNQKRGFYKFNKYNYIYAEILLYSVSFVTKLFRKTF